MQKLVGNLLVLNKNSEALTDREVLVEMTDARSDGTVELAVDVDRALPAGTTVFIRVNLADIVGTILKEKGSDL